MRIAIHNGTGGFTSRWIAYCSEKSLDYKLVNCYSSNVIEELEGCDVLLWHHGHDNVVDLLFAKQLIFALEQAGKRTFPDSKTCWHFNDKIGQFYLLQSIKAPHVETHAFYDMRQALHWAEMTSYPKVVKLRSGAGSSNVRLVTSPSAATSFIKRAFRKGNLASNPVTMLKDTLHKYREGRAKFANVVKAAGRIFLKSDFDKKCHRERNYVYFQDFLPNNKYDIRVIVIADKAFGIKRYVRKNDFRASGSGNVEPLDNLNIDVECLRIAFEVTRKLDAQCLAYDFIYDVANKPLIVEISYGFATELYDICKGYWTADLMWNPGSFIPQQWMIEKVLSQVKHRS